MAAASCGRGETDKPKALVRQLTGLVPNALASDFEKFFCADRDRSRLAAGSARQAAGGWNTLGDRSWHNSALVPLPACLLRSGADLACRGRTSDSCQEPTYRGACTTITPATPLVVNLLHTWRGLRAGEMAA